MSQRLLMGGALCVLVGCGCGGGVGDGGGRGGGGGVSRARPDGVNLLAGLTPRIATGVYGGERLTDRVIALPGDAWKTDLTAVFLSPRAFVEFDLGATRRLGAAYLQADNNDIYLLSVSEDGESFTRVWSAGPHRHPGMRPRFDAHLTGQGRYVRLSATGGDGSYSVSELQLFETPPLVFPPRLPARIGASADTSVRWAIGLFGAALILWLLFTFREAPRWWNLAVGASPLVAGVWLLLAISAGWPVGGGVVAFLRAMVAAVAVVAVAREAFAPRLFDASRPVVLTVLGLCAGLALASFFNLGYPQFRDHRDGSRTAVHHFDMRVYYPVAKYFPELRFDGVYLASVAAYVDDDPKVSLRSLGHVTFRDLDTHRMTRVSAVPDQVAAISQRFSPERWEAFKRDMRYFRTVMGPGYLGSMHDHGGNATPFWLAIAHLLFSATEASDTTLLATAALDPLLLLLTFLVIAWTFGWRGALVAMIVFGANDFYMFGSNWVGATLRHDWMVFLGLGICALKREGWLLAGVLLGWAAMIRAFPAFVLLPLAIPVLWWSWQQRRARAAWPSREELMVRLVPLVRVYAGAAICVATAFLFSGLVLDFAAWGEWLHKVSLLNRDAHVNHVSIRLLFEGLPGLRDGYPVLFTALRLLVSGLATGVLLWVARCRSLAQAAVLGLCLVPILLYPANYYAHFVFLLPLLATVSRRAPVPGRTDAAIWILLLLICVAQYGTVGASSWGVHFGAATWILMVGLAGILGLLIARDRAEHRAAAVPTGAGLDGVTNSMMPDSGQFDRRMSEWQ